MIGKRHAGEATYHQYLRAKPLRPVKLAPVAFALTDVAVSATPSRTNNSVRNQRQTDEHPDHSIRLGPDTGHLS